VEHDEHSADVISSNDFVESIGEDAWNAWVGNVNVWQIFPLENLAIYALA
jgi:hypothetical protein